MGNNAIFSISVLIDVLFVSHNPMPSANSSPMLHLMYHRFFVKILGPVSRVSKALKQLKGL